MANPDSFNRRQMAFQLRIRFISVVPYQRSVATTRRCSSMCDVGADGVTGQIELRSRILLKRCDNWRPLITTLDRVLRILTHTQQRGTVNSRSTRCVYPIRLKRLRSRGSHETKNAPGPANSASGTKCDGTFPSFFGKSVHLLQATIGPYGDTFPLGNTADRFNLSDLIEKRRPECLTLSG